MVTATVEVQGSGCKAYCMTAKPHNRITARPSDQLIHLVNELSEFITLPERKTETPAIPGDDI